MRLSSRWLNTSVVATWTNEWEDQLRSSDWRATPHSPSISNRWYSRRHLWHRHSPLFVSYHRTRTSQNHVRTSVYKQKMSQWPIIFDENQTYEGVFSKLRVSTLTSIVRRWQPPSPAIVTFGKILIIWASRVSCWWLDAVARSRWRSISSKATLCSPD